ncbi:MAG: hypothetical protein O3B84_06500 [Chloroflexi bacterium]|nr:hypothetical protein [Chloroflexota bacterium]
MLKKLSLFALLITAVSITACSGSSETKYVDVYRELIAEHASILSDLGAGPANLDISDRAMAQVISDRLEQLEIAAADTIALQLRWRALEPPDDLLAHYDLVSQTLDKVSEGFQLAMQGFEELGREVDRFVPNPDDANLLLASSKAALAEADALASAVNREQIGTAR